MADGVSASAATASTSRTRNQFGTFGGVFTPSILTILGAIMFLRANFVVGHAGIFYAILILCIAKTITLMTSLSIGAISTNMQVRGGGAYFLISRVLGPEFGGAIGIALFFALGLSVPFYILAFVEALRLSLDIGSYFIFVTLGAGAALFGVAYVGAKWALKVQYAIMLLLGLSILAFMGGAGMLWTRAVFDANWVSFAAGSTGAADTTFPFWVLFAIYFPAVTGIDAGLNMSGDLRNPARSIPNGTLAAVGVGFMVYLAQILLVGGAFPGDLLRSEPYGALKNHALGGAGFLVAAGVFAATLSSALGSYLGAPRVLQAVSRDNIIPLLKPFGKGTASGDEPRRALFLTGAITAVVLLWAGDASAGGALNSVAVIITMFFLYSYGMINLAAFIEAFGDNPSFRPTFKWFHWVTALIGALGCVAVAFLINPVAAAIAALLIAALVWSVRRRHAQFAFGDARRGFLYSAVRKNLIHLAEANEDGRNWRPTVLVFSGNPARREALVTYAVWLESGRGIVFLANVLVGEFEECAARRPMAIKQLTKFCAEHNIQSFPVVVVADDVTSGVRMLLQTASVGPLRPNLAVFGWSENQPRIEDYGGQLRMARSLGMSVLLLNGEDLPHPEDSKRIDLWWRGQDNGGLMMVLAHLLVHNWEWAKSEVRVLRVVENPEGMSPAVEALEGMIQRARMEATARVIVSDAPFAEILHEHSGDATCTLLGFNLPEEGADEAWHRGIETLLENMPTTILVHAEQTGDILA